MQRQRQPAGAEGVDGRHERGHRRRGWGRVPRRRGSKAPQPDAGDLCGQLITQVHKDPPNIYFVLDTSGSMATQVGPSTRYRLVQAAAIDLVKNIGGLINVGAALFPFAGVGSDGCHAGGEVLPVTPGDALNISTFSKLTSVQPNGGTPTAATLEALYPTLTKLPGRTIVVLATDGGPNCNAAASCGAEDCIDNIESACGPGGCCKPTGPSCCTAASGQGTLNCIDRKASIDAVAKLAAAGVRVYVVGVLGSETYGAVLDQMALVSGAPQIAPPFYYKVQDYSSLAARSARSPRSRSPASSISRRRRRTRASSTFTSTTRSSPAMPLTAGPGSSSTTAARSTRSSCAATPASASRAARSSRCRSPRAAPRWPTDATNDRAARRDRRDRGRAPLAGQPTGRARRRGRHRPRVLLRQLLHCGRASRPWARLWTARAAPGAPLVGFLISWHVADELHVLNIATVPAMRRRGIARALMEASLGYSSEAKIRIVLLEVRRSNRAAIKLYRGLAFTALGVRTGYYADNGEDAIEMILALDPESGAVLPGRDEIRIDG